MLPRRLAVLSALAAIGLTIAAACSEETPGRLAEVNEAGQGGGSGDCPAAAPVGGEACLLPDGTTCAFTCGSVIARCIAGAWLFSGNPAVTPVCPKDFPVSDSVCPACWSADASCTYGSVDCSAADASANTTIASCPEGRWLLDTYPCGILDAGADVQGDAEPDAD